LISSDQEVAYILNSRKPPIDHDGFSWNYSTIININMSSFYANTKAKEL